jgi:hypothetical protein
MCFIKDDLDHFEEKYAKGYTDFLVKKVRPKKNWSDRSQIHNTARDSFSFSVWVLGTYPTDHSYL